MSGKYRYRVQVEALGDDGESPVEPLRFEIGNHDDILAIAERVRAGMPFDEADACALAVGLKLFAGVMLAHRADPLFADIRSAMQAFIGKLKSQLAATAGVSKGALQ